MFGGLIQRLVPLPNTSPSAPCKKAFCVLADTATTMKTKPTTSSEQSSSGKLPCKNQLNLLADVGVTQPLTTETRNQDDAFLNGSTQPASPSHFHPGPYPSTQSQVVQSNSEPATGDAGPSVVKFGEARIPHMKLKLQIAKAELAPEGVHVATVLAIKAKGDSKCTVEFNLVADGNPFTVGKDYPAKLDRTSPLLRDAETIQGRKFADTKGNEEFDLETLVTKACQVVVHHKRTNGGRLVAAVETVLPAANAQPVAA